MSSGRSGGGKNPKDETQDVQPVRKKRVFAATCPRNASHENTRVYKTDGRTRYCVCDDCGETWKQNGPATGEAEVVDAA